jgi:broad specificity phosphatase PhoE
MPQPQRLVLVRHAQASYGTDDYDRLSERGLHQAQLLAHWLAAQPDLEFGAVHLGAQRRHAQTLSAIGTAAAAAGRSLPTATIDADWNEFDHESLLRGYVAHAPDDPDLEYLHGREPARVRALLGRAFAAWHEGVLDAAMPETLAAFRTRVERARRRAESDATTLVVSSGGAIARCAQVTFGFDEARTIEMNLALHNSGIVEFVRDGGTWSLTRWSDLPHLDTPEHSHLKSYY